ncbi:unnamed protein product (macronuclear) [Paramecium tetraurelia]|uniref:G-protein coupled receptors family 1 profile domain-containing protein n=1 Tax=Paramecium tetraurelia TaxID=5888 RepID=A0D2F8_PARTE|nr:uncharacterized protein GSPATT00012733001 [Paramecium tetraurelia]CAK77225.1 unnamed protein product [Paramecium tetraurelia]|eukprot:XP_001444622.1 hypothetical protein (macronuclear) [Paramecium tetraurelia strain d4-2]
MQEKGSAFYLTLLIIISVLSLIGCSVLLFDYLKQRKSANLAAKLLAILSISDAIYVIAVVINPTPQIDGALCVIQALLKQSSSVSTFIVNFFFCLTTSLTIVENIDITDDKYYKYIRNAKFFSVLFPFLIALIPLTYNGYGIQYYACSFKTQNNYWLGEFLLFYVPFGLFFGSSIYFLIKIKRFLSEIQSNKLGHEDYRLFRRTLILQNSQIVVGEQYTRFLFYYTLVHLFCWLPIILSSICEIIWKRDFVWFGGISYLCACSQGFLDFVLFMISKRVSSRSYVQERNSSYMSVEPVDIYRGSVVYNSSL